MKYLGNDNNYHFIVLDRFDINDSQLYSELWTGYHDWVLDNWKNEDLTYYLKITD